MDIIGGTESPMFEYLRELLVGGLKILKQHLEEFISLIKIMSSKQISREATSSYMTPAGSSCHGTMPCF